MYVEVPWILISDAGSTPATSTIISSFNLAVIVVREIISQSAVDGFKINVLLNNYSAGIFINGYDIDNAIFYKSDKFQFISKILSTTDLRDISPFSLVHTAREATLMMYHYILK